MRPRRIRGLDGITVVRTKYKAAFNETERNLKVLQDVKEFS